jgi:hypothetical protein
MAAKSCGPGRLVPRIAILVALFAGAATRADAGTPAPENLAPKARITADSEHNAQYKAQFVADGHIPREGGRNDAGKAWCVKGATHRGGATLTFEWPEPVKIAEVVYYGRTAFETGENWKDYEVVLDGAARPVLRGELSRGHGPQRIKLTGDNLLAPIPPGGVRTLALRFTSSYGGSNPGASEVQVYSTSPPRSALGRGPRPPAEESRDLARALADGGLGFEKLLVIQRRELNPTHVYTYHNEGFRAGGGLFVLDPGSDNDKGDGDQPELTQLIASPEGQILDCDMSYDGREILFSWRKSAKDAYHVYRMNVDGSALEQLTSGPQHDFNACWVPDGGIGFLSTRAPAFAYCWTSPVGVLHRMDRDGGHVKRLSANYLNDFTPSVLNDGSIIYSRWEYVDRPAIPIQSLWTINPDGTRLAVFFGNRVLSPATFMEPRAIPGSSKVLCLMTAHNGPCRGAIGIIDRSRGVNAQAAIRNLTPEVNIGLVDKGNGNHIRGPYESPCPVDDELFLVSRKGTIILRDYDGTKMTTVLTPRGGMGFYGPLPVRPRWRPPIRNSALVEAADGPVRKAEGQAWATVYLKNVYDGLEPHVKRGEVKEVRVVQEIEKSRFAHVKRRAFGFQFPVVSCGATYAPKKVWGHVPVDEDGSAAFRVPAGVPIYFMALDGQGRAVQRMRSFTHLMPGESQGCIGCHERRTGAAPMTVRPQAFKRPPRDLEPPEWGLGGFSYARVVQPVLDRHCVKCHDAAKPPKGIDLTGDLTDYFCVSYETLAREGKPGQNPYTKWIPTYNGQEANILLVKPKTWGSPASKLGDVVCSGHLDKDGKPRIKLPDADRRRILAWIDLNVPYYGTSSSNHYDLQGCRRMYPGKLDRILADVAKRRCATCHRGGKVPRKVWTRVTRPHLNGFLASPLAKAAGGTGKCGRAVFKTTDDPDYRAILATFEPLRQLLETKPRMDMADAAPAAAGVAIPPGAGDGPCAPGGAPR